MSKTLLFQTIQLNISIVFCLHTVKCQNSFFQTIQFSIKTVPFLTIQFSISIQFSFIWPIDRTLSGDTTLGQSGPGSDGNEEVLSIPQSSSVTGTSPSDCFMSKPGPLLWWWWGDLTLLQRCSQYILQPQLTG